VDAVTRARPRFVPVARQLGRRQESAG